MTEDDLKRIEDYARSGLEAMRAEVSINPADLSDLVAEVRRLQAGDGVPRGSLAANRLPEGAEPTPDFCPFSPSPPA